MSISLYAYPFNLNRVISEIGSKSDKVAADYANYYKREFLDHDTTLQIIEEGKGNTDPELLRKLLNDYNKEQEDIRNQFHFLVYEAPKISREAVMAGKVDFGSKVSEYDVLVTLLFYDHDYCNILPDDVDLLDYVNNISSNFLKGEFGKNFFNFFSDRPLFQELYEWYSFMTYEELALLDKEMDEKPELFKEVRENPHKKVTGTTSIIPDYWLPQKSSYFRDEEGAFDKLHADIKKLAASKTDIFCRIS